MKKRVIAGVAALLMVASCVPGNATFNFAPVTPIAVSAASVKEEVDGVTIERSESETENGTIVAFKLTPRTPDLIGLNGSGTELHVNLSDAVRDKVLEMGGDSADEVSIEKPSDRDNTLDKLANLSKIYFEDDLINTVGANFAQNCNNLSNVDFGDHIVKVGGNAFSNCSNLTGTANNDLDVSGIVEIGNNAFNGGKSINKITFGENLINVGKNAFTGTGIHELDIPASTESLGDGAFMNCTLLESVHFGSDDNMKALGSTLFSGCSKLSKLTVEGVDDSYNTTPNGVDDLMLGSAMFKGCTSLQNFCLPYTYEIIVESCFEGCTALNDFVFAGGVTGSQCALIYDKAFSGCSSLLEIKLPDANIAIDSNVFLNCSKLQKVEVSNNLSIVGEATFAGCWALSLAPRGQAIVPNKVILPDTWTVLRKRVFQNCSGLTSVDISPATTLEQEVFMGCSKLQSITIPDAVTEIGEKDFSGCTSLKDVVVSKNLTTLNNNVFDGCKALETFTPSDMAKMDYTLQFPASLGGVNKAGFQNCASFRYINFAENAEFSVVGELAFAGCTGLRGSNIGGNSNDTIALPAKVTRIQASAFKGDTSLLKVTMLGDVTSIGTSAFENCTSLEEVVMNDKITNLDGSAFKGCSSLKHMPETPEGNSAFTHIEKAIKASTFENCTALEDAYIPKNITQIEQNAFAGCTSLASVQWETGSKLTTIGNNAFNKCTSLTNFSSAATGTKAVFPSYVNSIGNSAFADTAFVEVVVGTPADNSTIYLGTGVFANNVAMERADLSASNVTEIPANAFSRCEQLKTVRLPETSLVKLGDSAFANCVYLHTFGDNNAAEGEYTLPASLKTIGNQAFLNNYCMEVINFPETTTNISLSMFDIHLQENVIAERGYTPLKTVNVDEANPNYTSVDGILYNKDMTALLCRPVRMRGDSFVVPDTVETISQSACAANIFLKNVTLNEDLKSIADKAFNDCQNLEYVDFGTNGTVTLGNTVFSRSGGKITLYATAGSTAQTYAEKNAGKVNFVDNAKSAAQLVILNKDGNEVNGTLTIAQNPRTYQLGCRQLTASGGEAADVLIWSTSDVEVATINDKGALTIKAMGEITVTVRNVNGTAEETITLVINENGISDDPDDFLPGDINGDGRTDVNDILALASHLKGLTPLSGASLERADVNHDDELNPSDLSALAAHVKGISRLS